MPESRDYYRGAIVALEGLLTGDPMPRSSTRVVIVATLTQLRAHLAALPPAEPAPELPPGKPLTYEDPSPCPDCAEVWGLVEECEKALPEVISGIEALVREGRFGINEDWARTVAGMAIDDTIKPILTKIAATRQKRGA